MNLILALKRTISEKPSHITFIRSDGQEEAVSYRDLYYEALRILGALQSAGVAKGDEVVLQLDDNKTLLYFFWACMLGKIIPVTLSPGAQPGQSGKLFGIWGRLACPWLVCEADQMVRLEAYAESEGVSKLFGDIWQRRLEPVVLQEHSGGGQEAVIHGDDIAYIQFSSGSTGDPKGVVLTHANLISNTSDIIRSLDITSGDKLISWLPLTHDMGMIGFHLIGAVGNLDAVSIATKAFIQRPLIWMETTSVHRATVLYSPNFGLEYFLQAYRRSKHQEWNLADVRIVVNGAEMISDLLCRDFVDCLAPYGMRAEVIVTAYGLAEASVEVCAMPPGSDIRVFHLNRNFLNIGDRVREVPADHAKSASFVDVGFPVSECRVRIIGEDGEPLPERMVGHIQINGKNVMREYYRDEEQTQKIFTAAGWLKTGDLGFLSEGRLTMTGRLKNIIIINGTNYYPSDIERLIERAGIAEPGKVVACAVRQSGRGGESLVVFVLFRGKKETFSSIQQAVQQLIREQVGIYVQDTIPVHNIPKTTSGKVQHFLLKERYLKGEFDAYRVSRAMEDGQDTGARVLGLLQTILGDNLIGPTTPFSASGLNSMGAMRLINGIREICGKDISIGELFQHNTVRALTDLLETKTGSSRIPSISPRSAETNPTELSPAQERIFREYLLDTHSSAYHIPVAFTVCGGLDKSLLQRCVRMLISKYEILRTSFEWTEDGPLAFIHDYSDDLFAVGDDPTDFIDWPFVLEQPTQVRVLVRETGSGEWQVVFVFHHILIDGWSLMLLFDEMTRYYDMEPAEAGMPLAALQFRDYVAWQKDLAATAVWADHRRYWLEALTGLPAAVHLACGRMPIADIRRRKMRQYRYTFTAQEMEQLGRISTGLGVTPFCTVMTLLNVLTYRYTGFNDIVIGFDVTGRIAAGSDRVIGYLLNTLPLRADVHGEMSFGDLAGQVRHKIELALDHQLYPFESMLADRKEESGKAATSMFGLLVLYQDFLEEQAPVKWKGFETRTENIAVRDGYIDLVFEFIMGKEQPGLVVSFNEDLYKAGSISRLCRHFGNLIRAASTSFSTKIAFLDMLTFEEKAILLPPAKQEPNTLHLRLPVHILFQRRTAATPDSIAVSAGEIRLTYRELNRLANKLANYILGLGKIKADDRIGLLVSPGEKTIVALLAILKTGGCYVALDPEIPIARCETIIRDSGMRYLLVDDDQLERVRDYFARDILIPMQDEAIGEAEAGNPDYNGSMEQLAYVIYTSGSTGQPKGVMISHETLASYVRNFIQLLDISGEDVFIQQSSVMFDTIVEEVFPALCTSGRIVVAQRGARDIEDLLATISTQKVTVLSGTPLVLQRVNACVDSRIATLRLVISGGDRLHPADIDHLIHYAEVYNSYGPSETTVCATYTKVRTPAEAALIGKAIPRTRVYVLDKDMQVLPVGRMGEIYIDGGLARGYLNRPELTRERFVPNPFTGGERLFRTGDLGRILECGNIEFLGRNDLQIKIRGHRVEPEEIESCIKGYRGIMTAAVLRGETPNTLNAFLMVREGFQAEGLKRHIANHLPIYMFPQRFFILEDMPLTATGKVDRGRLADGVATAVELSQGRSAGSEMEERLLRLAKEILGTERLGADSNFFEFGFDSIHAARLMGRVHKELLYKISIKDIFLYPSVALLAQRIFESAVAGFMPLSRVPLSAGYELSPAQKRLWVLSRLPGSGTAYHEGELFELKGKIDPEKVRKSLEAVVQRYEALRTVFRQEDGEPIQMILAFGKEQVDFEYSECEAMNRDELTTWLEGYRTKSFDLEKGPLYRFRLIRAGDEGYFLGIVLHHIIVDDWSVRLLMQAFFSYYSEGRSSREGGLRTGIEYKDYAAWISGNIRAGNYVLHGEYWKSVFHDGIPVMELPLDRPRPMIKKGEAGILYLTFDLDLTTAMRIYCQQKNTSLFILLLSSLSILLSRYSGQEDLVIAVPVSGRDHPDLEDVAGFFVNILPVRIRVDAEVSLSQLVKKVMTICLDAYEHRMYPFEEMIGVLRPDRAMNRSPLFDVLANFSRIQDLPFSEEGLSFNRLEKKNAGSKCDLAFYFEERSGQTGCVLEYDAELFSADGMRSMLRHLRNIVQVLLEKPDIRVRAVDYLDEWERHQLLYSFNNTAVVYPSEHVLLSFLQCVDTYPHNTCIVQNGVSPMTYSEVYQKSNGLSHGLQVRFGVRAGDRVGVLMNRCGDLIVSVLGIWMAGAVYVPMDPEWPEERITYVIRDAGIGLLLTDGYHEDSGHALEKKTSLRLLRTDRFTGDQEYGFAGLRSAGEDAAYILYTSGTTGNPKGVEVRHSSLMNILSALKERPGVCSRDVMLSVSSCSFDISLTEFFLPLIGGGQLVLAHKSEVKDVFQLKGLLAMYAPTLMQATPGLWQALVRCGWEGNPELKAITCGEPLTDTLKADLLTRVAQLWNLYGPTEATIFATGKQIVRSDERITIGAPMANTHIYVLDRFGQPAPVGMFGEIYIAGKGLANGYLNRPDLTAERFREKMAVTGERVYRSGDIGRWLSDGTIDYLGRNDDQVKIRGFRIELGEIEDKLLAYPGVSEAIVVVKERGDDKILIAYLVYREDQDWSAGTMRSYLSGRLPEYMIPAQLIRIDRMPLSLSGKVDKKTLAAGNTFLPETDTRSILSPETPMEELVLKLWAALLEKKNISITDNFFDIGGHSLKANQLVNQLRQRLDLEIGLADIFLYPTLRQLAGFLSSLESQQFDYIELN